MEAYRVLSKPDARRNYDIGVDSRPVYASTGFSNPTEAHEFE